MKPSIYAGFTGGVRLPSSPPRASVKTEAFLYRLADLVEFIMIERDWIANPAIGALHSLSYTMKKILLLLLLCLQYSVSAQNCVELQRGSFELSTFMGKIIIERSYPFQLEISNELGVIYLNKIEKISDCEYNLRRYKVIKNDAALPTNMNDVLNVKVDSSEGNDFHITSTLAGTEMSIEGRLTKLSNEISEIFKEILKEERNQAE